MLYDRIIKQGTINEPGGKPDPQFALPSTVNWMHALRILVEDQGINFATAEAFYNKQGKRTMDVLAENTVMEQLLLGCTIYPLWSSFGPDRKHLTMRGSVSSRGITASPMPPAR